MADAIFALPTPPPPAMLKPALKQRADTHNHNPHLRPPKAVKPHQSTVTVKTLSSGPSSSSVSFPSDYTCSSSYLSRSGHTLEYTQEEDEDDTEALLASAWRYPMGTLRAEPVPGMPLHVENIKTEKARGGIGSWHVPSAETLCAQIGHDARPRLHRCFLNAFLVPVACCDHFATTRCRRCNLPIQHDDESCTRCPARWLREKTGVDETGNIGSRSRLVVDDNMCTLAATRSGVSLSPQMSHISGVRSRQS